jgi:aminoglycoside phosphotransferase (APT) family kinase protein
VGESKVRPMEAENSSERGIPGLESVLDPVVMEQHLRRVLPDDRGPIRDLRFRILRHKRGRCTFEIAWPGADGWRAVIGKAYATDRADVYRTMETIRAAGFGPDDAFSIPEPLGYVPELHVLLQEKVHGPRAKQVFLTGSERDRTDAAERAGRWLARFQATAPLLGEADPAEDLLQSAQQWSRDLTAVGGPLADKAARLGEQLAAAARGRRPIEFCAGHGDFRSGQILLAERRTVTVDWDRYDAADPCRDVATFVVGLERIAWKIPDASALLDRVAEHFLGAYFSCVSPAVRVNLPLYEAARCLAEAHKDVRRRETGWIGKAPAILDHGLRALAMAQAEGRP